MMPPKYHVGVDQASAEGAKTVMQIISPLRVSTVAFVEMGQLFEQLTRAIIESFRVQAAIIAGELDHGKAEPLSISDLRSSLGTDGAAMPVRFNAEGGIVPSRN